jgi:hypothetical protein
MGDIMTFTSKTFGATTICLLAVLANCAGSAAPKAGDPHVAQKKSVAPVAKKQKSAPVPTPQRPVSTVPRARDPQIAVQEEFDAATAKNTLAGWDLFLARHGDNVLAARASSERARVVAASNVKK